MSKKGLVIVISAPSGVGKSTICDYLVKKSTDIKYSISYTTRPPRPGEKNGVEYFFVSDDEFRKMVHLDKFVEWANVHGFCYGTPTKYIEEVISTGMNIILDIDVQGGVNIGKIFPEAVLVFLMAPSMTVVEERLRRREKDSEEVISRRLENAKNELRYLKQYKYLVINDNIQKACKKIRSIITAEHLKIDRTAIAEFN